MKKNKNKNKNLDFIFIKSDQTKENNKVIVAFHGWRGNKTSFLPMAKSTAFQGCDWYLPEAPYLVDNDNNQRTWSYEIEEGIWESKNISILLNNFFELEVFKKYDSKNVYVIGFSQGALVCYEFICKLDKPLGAIFPISGFMREGTTTLHPNQKNTPIIIGHGSKDNIVSVERSKEAYEHLKKYGTNIELEIYEEQHRISIQMIKKIIKTLKTNDAKNE